MAEFKHFSVKSIPQQLWGKKNEAVFYVLKLMAALTDAVSAEAFSGLSVILWV